MLRARDRVPWQPLGTLSESYQIAAESGKPPAELGKTDEPCQVMYLARGKTRANGSTPMT